MATFAFPASNPLTVRALSACPSPLALVPLALALVRQPFSPLPLSAFLCLALALADVIRAASACDLAYPQVTAKLKELCHTILQLYNLGVLGAHPPYWLSTGQ